MNLRPVVLAPVLDFNELRGQVEYIHPFANGRLDHCTIAANPRSFGKNVSANVFEVHVVKLHVDDKLLV